MFFRLETKLWKDTSKFTDSNPYSITRGFHCELWSKISQHNLVFRPKNCICQYDVSLIINKKRCIINKSLMTHLVMAFCYYYYNDSPSLKWKAYKISKFRQVLVYIIIKHESGLLIYMFFCLQFPKILWYFSWFCSNFMKLRLVSFNESMLSFFQI